jgi:hypothetical protein
MRLPIKTSTARTAHAYAQGFIMGLWAVGPFPMWWDNPLPFVVILTIQMAVLTVWCFVIDPATVDG